MNPIINTRLAELTAACRRYHVKRLDLFGSATTDTYDPETSDLDFLVEFAPAEKRGPADQYFGLWDDLKALFESDVDLVTIRSLKNPYFIRAVNETRTKLYAA